MNFVKSNIILIFALVIDVGNANSKNTYLKNSPREGAPSFVEKSIIGNVDNSPLIGLPYFMNCTILTKKQEKEIATNYKNHVSILKLCNTYKVGYGRIKNILRVHGICLRNKREQNMKYSINENFFDTIGPEQSWLLGLFAADGSVSKEKYISISQSKSVGLKLIKHIKNILSYDGKIYTGNQKMGDKKYVSYSLWFSSPKIANIFKQFNIVNNKTLIYELPDTAMDFKNFLRGYFDGDGSVGIYGNGNKKGETKYLQASFVGTKNFISQCQDRIMSEGVISGNIGKTKAKNLFSLTWNGKKAIQFLSWLWSDANLWTWYKQDIFKDFQNNYNPKYRIVEAKRNNVIKMTNEGWRYIDIKRKYGYGASFIVENMKRARLNGHDGI